MFSLSVQPVGVAERHRGRSAVTPDHDQKWWRELHRRRIHIHLRAHPSRPAAVTTVG